MSRQTQTTVSSWTIWANHGKPKPIITYHNPSPANSMLPGHIKTTCNCLGFSRGCSSNRSFGWSKLSSGAAWPSLKRWMASFAKLWLWALDIWKKKLFYWFHHISPLNITSQLGELTSYVGKTIWIQLMQQLHAVPIIVSQAPQSGHVPRWSRASDRTNSMVSDSSARSSCDVFRESYVVNIVLIMVIIWLIMVNKC